MGTTLPKPILSKVVERVGSEDVAAACCSINGYRNTMEDAHCMVIEENYMLFGIFDGHSNGRCSQYIASNLPLKIKSCQNFPITDDELEEICISLDKEYINKWEEGGTTGTFVIIEKKKSSTGRYRATIANVGDSRTIVIRNGEMIFYTIDHKPQNPEEKKRIENCGGIVRMNRVDGNLAVSRAFGDSIYKLNSLGDGNDGKNLSDINLRNQRVVAVPEISHLEIHKDDIILLACDGVFEGNFENNDVTKFVVSLIPPPGGDYAVVGAKACDKAVMLGSKDNISCMIVQMVDGRDYFSKFGPTSFVPGPPYTKKHGASKTAYKQMAEIAGSNLEDALKRRYKLFEAYVNKKLDTLPPLDRVTFESYDEEDAKNESEFWAKASGSLDDFFIYKLK